WRPAGHAVMALCGYSAGAALVSVASETWKAAGQTRWLSRAHGLDALLAVALTIAFLPLGLVGVAGGLSLASLLTGIYALRVMKLVIGTSFSRLAREIWAPALAAVAMAGALYPLQLALAADRRGAAVGVPLLLGEALAGLAFYAALLSLLA